MIPVFLAILLLIVAKILANLPDFIGGVFAVELRWEVLNVQTADGTTSANSAAEFRNDSSRTMHIRIITVTMQLDTAANDETGLIEISKSPTLAINTNNNVFYTWPTFLGVSGGTTGAALDDVSFFENKVIKYGKGQLTLEPNESLFVNVSKSSGGTVQSRYVIGYQFGKS